MWQLYDIIKVKIYLIYGEISMKKFLVILACVIVVFSLTACGGVSNKKYNEISNYVLSNIDNLSPEKELEFYVYKTTGIVSAGVYYGYYYTANNEIAIPDFYKGDNLGEKYEADGGTYFGKPNNGTDWYFAKVITDNWYYYELHWG